MTTLLRLALLRWLATKSFGGALALLATFALPLAAILKVIGLPILIVLGIVALPVGLVLLVVGLPLLLVAGAVAAITALLGVLLALGLAALKLALPILLVVGAFLLLRWLFRRLGGHDEEPSPADTVGSAI